MHCNSKKCLVSSLSKENLLLKLLPKDCFGPCTYHRLSCTGPVDNIPLINFLTTEASLAIDHTKHATAGNQNINSCLLVTLD